MSRPGPTDFDPQYEDHKTDFARSIDRQVQELRDITNTYHSFIDHLRMLQRFLRALAGYASDATLADTCGHCGLEGVMLRRAIRDFANYHR
jgi:hypothetical protein